MDIEITAEAKSKSLNRLVAVTVVVLSVFLGIAKIKDDNLVQAMAQAKADALDTWGEYQASKTKLHIAQTAGTELRLLQNLAGPAKAAPTAAAVTALDQEAAKYEKEIPALQVKARGFEARYDALNYHDDQFDLCDALVSIAVSAAAVAALTESSGVLYAAWGFGGLGVLFGLAGFFGWMIHPNVIAGLLS
jgi:hypothetical protein